LFKSGLLCVLCLFVFSACENQKQTSAEVGAIPKQTIDRATSEINDASAVVEERLKSLESLDAADNLPE
jgi:hypothetical protein